MNKLSAWQSQAYLDSLRPDPGWEVRGAILTSYSADIRSIVAALLALAARDDDRGRGGKADLAEAIELLRGKVRILIQRGRLARPRRIPLIAGILDQFVREIDFDETEQSWHPKVNLVQVSNGGSTSDWRLWLGSRNLTAAVNRDFGLLLISNADRKDKNASPIPGVGSMAQRLAQYARIKPFRTSALRKTLERVRWSHPSRLHVERIILTGGQGTDKGPIPPNDLDEVIAISPFLDGGVVKMIGSWGDAKTHRHLLSTELALTKIAKQAAKPLSGFKDNLFVLDMPAPEPVEPMAFLADDDASVEEDETEDLPVGLHAKIFSARKGKRLHLWVGSANATHRAWTGANVEVIAEITTAASIQEGLITLLNRPVSTKALEARELPQEADTYSTCRRAAIWISSRSSKSNASSIAWRWVSQIRRTSSSFWRKEVPR